MKRKGPPCYHGRPHFLDGHRLPRSHPCRAAGREAGATAQAHPAPEEGGACATRERGATDGDRPQLQRQRGNNFEVIDMTPPIFPQRMGGPRPLEYIHLARMFRDASVQLPNYVGPEQNWPAYALLLHSCELALKAFCAQSVANGKPEARTSNHDLRGWYDIALQYGLPADPRVGAGIDILTELHAHHYTRYPDNRTMRAPELSNVVGEVVDSLIASVSPLIYQR